MKIADFLSGTKILQEVESPINGKISVVKSLAFGVHIQVGGLTQSGGIIKNVWKKALKEVRNQKSPKQRKLATGQAKVKTCLVLGLGGGSIVEIVKKYYPEAEITGVDLDPIMVGLGEKYLGLKKKDLRIVIDDAYGYVSQKPKLKSQKFELILVDLYIGDEFPKKFESEDFIQKLKRAIAHKGIIVFNRLYFGEKRSEAMKFKDKLEKIFDKVDVVYPEANIMFVCYS